MLVGVDFGFPHFDSELEELGLLAQTAGLDPVTRLVCKRKVPDAALFVGSGKADQYVVLLRNTVTQMVYKHAISTIVPGRAVNFSASESQDSEPAAQ